MGVNESYFNEKNLVKLVAHHCLVYWVVGIGNESVPKIIINNTINLFFKLQSAFCYFQTITVSEF